MENKEEDGHLLVRGDTVDAMEEFVADESVDLVFADPPYNIGKNFNGRIDRMAETEYIEWSYSWLSVCVRKLKPTGSMYVMTSTQFMPYFDLFLRDKVQILSRIIWSYDSSGVQARKYYGSMYEPILFAVKDPAKYTFNAKDIKVAARTGSVRKLIDYRKDPPQPYSNDKVPGNVWYIPRVRYRMEEYEEHPSQKPVALLERIILASSNEGDTVLDPFAGTFTTSFVSRKLKRHSISVENDEDYFKIGLRRVLGLTHYNGIELRPPSKNYGKVTVETPSLFGENGLE